MKYIDSEKFIAELKRKIGSIENCPFQLASFGEERKSEGELIAYKDALFLITSLQQEQPSLPSNLDEAAEEYHLDIKAKPFGGLVKEAFKAGAEWMAGQGYAREVEVKEDAGGYPYIPCIELYDYDKDEPLAKEGDKVKVIILKEQ